MRRNTDNGPHRSPWSCMTRTMLCYERGRVNCEATMFHFNVTIQKNPLPEGIQSSTLIRLLLQWLQQSFFLPFPNKMLLTQRKISLGKLKSASVITHLRLTLGLSRLSAHLLYCFSPPLQTTLKMWIQHSIRDSRAKQAQGVPYLHTLPQKLSKIHNAS